MINFLLGMIFITVALPILECITSAACTRIEEYKAKHGVQIAKYNREMAQCDENKKSSHPIGFTISTEEEEDENDDDVL